MMLRNVDVDNPKSLFHRPVDIKSYAIGLAKISMHYDKRNTLGFFTSHVLCRSILKVNGSGLPTISGLRHIIKRCG